MNAIVIDYNNPLASILDIRIPYPKLDDPISSLDRMFEVLFIMTRLRGMFYWQKLQIGRKIKCDKDADKLTADYINISKTGTKDKIYSTALLYRRKCLTIRNIVKLKL